jgi:hypothetical protein
VNDTDQLQAASFQSEAKWSAPGPCAVAKHRNIDTLGADRMGALSAPRMRMPAQQTAVLGTDFIESEARPTVADASVRRLGNTCSVAVGNNPKPSVMLGDDPYDHRCIDITQP